MTAPYNICKRNLIVTALPDDRLLIRDPNSRNFDEIRFEDFLSIIGSDVEFILIRHDASLGTINFPLPSVSSLPGDTKVIHKRLDTVLENDVFLVPFTGDTIDSETANLRMRSLESYTLITDISRDNWDLI